MLAYSIVAIGIDDLRFGGEWTEPQRLMGSGGGLSEWASIYISDKVGI
jgi:hypothetical protein